MATADLILGRKTLVSTKDSVVIRNYVAGIKGGATLDVEGFEPDVICAGHVIIRDTVTGDYKPMPVVIAEGADPAYDELPDDHVYVGVCVATVPTKAPFVGVMYSGEVNDVASPYPLDDILEGVKAACPLLAFMHD